MWFYSLPSWDRVNPPDFGRSSGRRLSEIALLGFHNKVIKHWKQDVGRYPTTPFLRSYPSGEKSSVMEVFLRLVWLWLLWLGLPMKRAVANEQCHGSGLHPIGKIPTGSFDRLSPTSGAEQYSSTRQL